MNTYAQQRRILTSIFSIWAAAWPVFAAAAEVADIKVRRTGDQIRYGLIGEIQPVPATTLFLLAHGIEEMQRQPVYTEVARILARHGWISVIIEPPCHGEDERAGEPVQLNGWRQRLEQGEDLIAPLTVKTRSVLESLVKEGTTDPTRIAVCGTSRGGFLAVHLAAVEPRFKAVAAISPVTRLLALSEFSRTTGRTQAEMLDLTRLAPQLTDRAVWVSIGNNDQRVQTDDAITFTREVVRAAARTDKPDAIIPVELIVAPTPGHAKIDQAHELLATWLLKQFPAK